VVRNTVNPNRQKEKEIFLGVGSGKQDMHKLCAQDWTRVESGVGRKAKGPVNRA
jgi:hypothetical protein